MKAIFLLAVGITLFDCNFCFDGMLGKITSGIEIAGKFLGLDQASDVAQLVSDAFSNTNRRSDENDKSNNVFSGFLRLLGFDTKKIGAIGVNAIIFVAQLISSSLAKPPPTESREDGELKEESPFDWMMNNSRIVDILGHVKDTDLSTHVVEYIKTHSFDEETDCIQLLICKTTPFIKGMQESLEQKWKGGNTGKVVLFEHLPSLEEVAIFGDQCERKHPYCLIHF